MSDTEIERQYKKLITFVVREVLGIDDALSAWSYNTSAGVEIVGGISEKTGIGDAISWLWLDRGTEHVKLRVTQAEGAIGIGVPTPISGSFSLASFPSAGEVRIVRTDTDFTSASDFETLSVAMTFGANVVTGGSAGAVLLGASKVLLQLLTTLSTVSQELADWMGSYLPSPSLLKDIATLLYEFYRLHRTGGPFRGAIASRGAVVGVPSIGITAAVGTVSIVEHSFDAATSSWADRAIRGDAVAANLPTPRARVRMTRQ